MSIPPAQPIKISPSSSESRFSKTVPLIKSGSSANAPVKPVSSSTVIRHSSGPCLISFEVSTAICAAIPIPQSAPKVVPLAFTQPSTITGSMGSLSKSNSLSLFFSQTISMCVCKITVGLFSRPGAAGFEINTFPALSVFAGRLFFLAKSSRNFLIFSSFFEGRGT